MISKKTYDDEGKGVNKGLREECPPRKSRYGGRYTTHGYLAAEKEEHHEIDDSRPSGIYNPRFRHVARLRRAETHM